MTHTEAFAPDRWILSIAVDRRDSTQSWRLSDWIADPLERALLVAVALVGAFLLWTLLTADDATGMTARDACVMSALDEARTFAGVMGDDRPVGYSFAERACARP